MDILVRSNKSDYYHHSHILHEIHFCVYITFGCSTPSTDDHPFVDIFLITLFRKTSRSDVIVDGKWRVQADQGDVVIEGLRVIIGVNKYTNSVSVEIE